MCHLLVENLVDWYGSHCEFTTNVCESEWDKKNNVVYLILMLTQPFYTLVLSTHQSFKISSKETFSKTALINDTTGLHNNDIQHGAGSEHYHR